MRRAGGSSGICTTASSNGSSPSGWSRARRSRRCPAARRARRRVAARCRRAGERVRRVAGDLQRDSPRDPVRRRSPVGAQRAEPAARRYRELDLHAEQRLPSPVGVAAYYVVSEALANAPKYAQASVVNVEFDTHDAVMGVTRSPCRYGRRWALEEQ
jgi:signal transduction histidine kinase